MIIHPKAAYHLKRDLAEKGLESISGDVLRTGEVNALLVLSSVYVTANLEKRSYSGSDETRVNDVIICQPRDAGVGGYRRQLRIERDRDVEAGLTKIAASLRFAWRIAKTDAVYKLANVLSHNSLYPQQPI
jgi:hypothetical protein